MKQRLSAKNEAKLAKKMGYPILAAYTSGNYGHEIAQVWFTSHKSVYVDRRDGQILKVHTWSNEPDEAPSPTAL